LQLLLLSLRLFERLLFFLLLFGLFLLLLVLVQLSLDPKLILQQNELVD